jgi:DtxR family transcriptional regulator, Mn-dependent transcriptional regulator
VNISNSEENYLKTIFHLQTDTDKVNTNAVAEKLNTKPASVTDMMKRLSAKKLLDYQPYKGFSLSGEGKKIALGIVRRHRLWEYFLVEKLQLGWDEVHEIAEELEHVSSKRLIDKLDEYLGYPKFDPHGDPIPDSKGKLRRSNEILLLQLPLNQRAEVSRVGNQSVEMLELLQHKNIRIGTRIEVKNNFSFDGSIEVKVKNATVTISEQLAQNIFVTYES